jgi:hypothetical protein
MQDTSAEIEERMRQMMMKLSGAERMLMGASMFDAARAMILASFPKSLTENEVKRKLCERTYGFTLEDFLAGLVEEIR